MRVIRHGDVVLVEGALPGEARRAQAGKIVLAEGEVTGHAHVVDGPAELWTLEESEPRTAGTARMFLRVLEEGGVELTHEEHATLTIPPGDWEVQVQREYAPEANRQVTD